MASLTIPTAPPFLGVADPAMLLPADGPAPKVVVTGGAGFVGSVLVRWLLAAGYRVHVVDNLMYGGHSLLPLFIHPRFVFEELDILDRPGLAKAFEGADAVIHLAALVGYPLCKKEPERATAVNVQGTQNVLDLCPADVPLLYASTGSNYGEVAGTCTEDTPLNPLSLYGENKTLAEQMCMERPNTVSFRFATAFGLSPRLRLDLMINDFTHQALIKRYLLVYERHFRRTFIHVQDMARAFLHTLGQFEAMKDHVYNVGDDSMNFTKEDITTMLSERTNYLLYFADIGSDEDKRDYKVSYERIRNTGYRTAVTMEHGLDELIAGLRLVRIRNPHSNV
jgi:nucleoside-diphosphate-sugar epimerase